MGHDGLAIHRGVTDASSFERLSIYGDEVRLRVVDSGDVEVIEYLSEDREGPPAHSHPWDEVEYVIEGEVEILVDDEWTRGGPGTVQMLPRGVGHAVRVPVGSARLLMITIGPPYAGLARDVAALGVAGYPDPAELVRIAEKHGLRLVGGR